jgi:hypothetical protein
MQNRFNDNRDFEQFVKQNADQYRMFPSEKVWNNIHNTLHVRRRWYGIGIALLLITVTAVTLVMVNHPDKNQPLPQTSVSTVNNITPPKTNPEKVFIAPTKTTDNNATVILRTGKLPAAIFQPAEFKNQPDVVLSNVISTTPTVNSTEPTIANVKQTDVVTSSPRVSNVVATAKPIALKAIAAIPSKTITTTIVDNSIETATTTEQMEQATSSATDINLLTIESVVNSYKNKRKAKKLTLQLYVTPTVSYRALKENSEFINAVQSSNASPLAPTPNLFVPDVNNIVTHKPDIGFQLGISAGYPLSKNITLTGGLQFTVSKYDIKAYRHTTEEARIAVSNDAGGANTLSTYTSYRNYGGNKVNWLHNLYLSASAPIGLELKLINSRRGHVGIGGTIQPTYVIDNRSYLLSTDFKNYAEVPSLIRRWNINTGFEIFVANTAGKVKWRIGPQVRYQTMSSFKEKYPVKEHLFDFGLKLGVLLK